MYGFGAQGLNGNVSASTKPFFINIIESALWRAHEDSKSKESDEKTAAQLYFIEFGEELLKEHGKEDFITAPLQPGPTSTYYSGCDRTDLVS